MTAASMTYNRPNWGGLFILAALMFGAALLLYELNHSVLKHGPKEVKEAHDCSKKNGIFMTFRERNGRVHRLCREGGSIYDIITEFKNGIEEYVTSFNTRLIWKDVLDWLARKNATPWKSAPPFIHENVYPNGPPIVP